ncbi:gamma-butyrobetaine dioxygenase [Musca domestica]|uniref:Gamma-butyrobetaine dioxygenase n=1 Tax=Musca domestica TaxID=7370 RepID=A0A1I8N4G5_MUSDO|nr:gamma-butyrobetaine dioxygenase [Musca domestica]
MLWRQFKANFNYTNRSASTKLLLSGNCFANTLNRLLGTQLINDGRVLVVEEDTKKSNSQERSMKFPIVWLRDNCQCSECFHGTTKSRKTNWEPCNNIAARAARVVANAEKNAIIIDWQDAHKSEYDLQWLRKRDFSPEQRKAYIESVYKPKEVVWGKQEFADVLKIYDFQKIIGDDTELYNWIRSLAIYGVNIVKNAPHDTTVAQQLGNRIGIIKKTAYGEQFEIKSKENPSNYAYLMVPLPLHIDVPYYENIAGIHILHCLVQSAKGGENTLTDGFYVADQIRQHYPKYYESLLKTPVDWHDIGKDGDIEYHNIWREPVINLDVDGRYHRINFNTIKRDSHFSVPLEAVDLWYEAYNKFIEIANETAVQFKTHPGDVFVFNNRRMLHGRTAFEDTPDNKRHLIGAYVDWDYIYSKMRVLQTKLGITHE